MQFSKSNVFNLQVLFVDYGNIESCEAKELRIANILGNVAIQATKYYLAYVKPISDDGTWPQKVLEFIHVHIVNKSVFIRVEDNVGGEYVPCTLTVGPMDLIKTLFAEKLAEYTPNLNVNLNLPVTHDFYDSKENVRDVDKYKESVVALDEFKKQMAKKTEIRKAKETFNKYDLNHSIEYIIEDSDVEVFQRNNSLNRDSIDDYDMGFEPRDTSTTISTAMKSFTLSPFQPLKFPKDVTKFPCKIYEVLDTLHFFVEPLIEDHNFNFDLMEKKIKKSYNGKTGNCAIGGDRYCLAPYSEDESYYRAVIEERIGNSRVRVRFVDYLNDDIVECEALRQCPAELLKKPLKHLIVRLHGVKPTKRVRDSDIKRQMESLIGQTVTALIVKNDTIPSVRLYDNQDTKVVAYKRLIDENFFTETRD